MSVFSTSIPVDTDAIKSLLPVNAIIENVTFDGKAVRVIWHSGRLVTPYSFPVDFPLDKLKNKTLPDKVRYADAPAAVPTAPVTISDKPKAAKAPKSVKK